MIFRRKKDILLPLTAPAPTGAAAAAQTITFRIKQEQRRLEGFILSLQLTNNAAIPTGAAWGGMAGVVKEIRVKVQDALGSRNAVQVSGIGCLSWVKNQLGRLDRNTQTGYATAALPAFATENVSTINYFVPLRHPIVSEPFGNYLALPLSSKFLGDDVIVEVDLWDIGAAAGTVFLANSPTWPANAASLQTLVREVPEEFGYIPSELRSDMFAPSAVANATYEFTSNGYLTSALVQGLSASAFGNGLTRASILATGGNLQFQYGRDIWLKDNEAFSNALNDLSADNYPSATTATITGSALTNRNMPNEIMIDFLADLPQTDAFSVGSIPNLYTAALGGDKARLVFNDFAAVGRAAHITMHRFLPIKADDLSALALSI